MITRHASLQLLAGTVQLAWEEPPQRHGAAGVVDEAVFSPGNSSSSSKL